MKLMMDKKNDALYFRLDESAVVESEEIQPGVILDYDAKGKVIGMEILRVSQRVSSGKAKSIEFISGDMRAEYDFASMKGGVKGKYFRRYLAGTNVVLLKPEIARFFRTETDVNEALLRVMKGRAVAKLGERSTTRKTAQTHTCTGIHKTKSAHAGNS